MRVHLYHQYFRHPDEGGALRSYFIGKALQEAGHEVVIITAHNTRKGLTDVDNLPVHYLRVAYSNDFSFGRRIRSFLRFVILSLLKARHLPKPDINYIITTPLTTGLIGLALKKWQGVPFAFEVGDLWPEVPVQMGMIKNGLLKRSLYQLEKTIYHHAEKLIGLSPPIKDYIEYHCDFNVEAISIPNMADTEFFSPTSPPEQFSMEEPFVICYIGTFGRANHLDYLIALARICHEKELPVSFHLMGEGAKRDLLGKEAGSLENITLHEFGDRAGVKLLMDRAHAAYVSFLDVPILNTGSPNKFFDGLAAGKLMLLNFGGWMKKLIDVHECGLHCPPNDPQASIDILKPFLGSPLLLEEYQANARLLAESTFSRKLLTQQLIDHLANR